MRLSIFAEKDRKLFLKCCDCQSYALAINARETSFLTEPLIMVLLLTQHKLVIKTSPKAYNIFNISIQRNNFLH
jgi:hypothetical protein